MIKQIFSEVKAELKPAKLIVLALMILAVPAAQKWVLSKLKPEVKA